MPFFTGASDFKLDRCELNDIAGSYTKTDSRQTTENHNSNNTSNTANTNSHNDSSQKMGLKGESLSSALAFKCSPIFLPDKFRKKMNKSEAKQCIHIHGARGIIH
ncbi:hypothetical protein BDQ12DRAFT_666505 [Crucibulum laeve]|uniref:Uncharacterized protein n=1 Tax=Crucibulum laeve TaxID=68775 RepID=A0A5C3LYX4_9AGAR|nr:hypothetical protein BDQ12DRAFT_666505 [Crucibulum laeve]